MASLINQWYRVSSHAWSCTIVTADGSTAENVTSTLLNQLTHHSRRPGIITIEQKKVKFKTRGVMKNMDRNMNFSRNLRIHKAHTLLGTKQNKIKGL